MDKEQLRASGLIQQYVMGLTSPEETEMVEQCMNEHPELMADIDRMRGGIHSYCSKRLKPFGKMGMTELMHKYKIAKRCIGITTLIVLGLSLWIYKIYQKTKLAEAQLSLLSANLEGLQEDYDKIKSERGMITNHFKMISDISTHKVQLKRIDCMSPCATVYYNPEKKNTLVDISNLELPPEGHQYHLWSHSNGQQHNLGKIECPRNSPTLYNLPFIENLEQFVLTIEPSERIIDSSVEKLLAKGKIEL